jgi:beta-lactamase class A
MSANLRLLVIGNALSKSSREQLTAWLLGNKTGATRLRARLPQGWRNATIAAVGEAVAAALGP